jgi:monoamine oxidase
MKNHHSKIIIIGAGYAGLTAAKLLHESGQEVLILEASETLGGRARTIHLDGAPLDAGAAWVHYKSGNIITKTAMANGLEIIDDQYEPSFIFDKKKGKTLSQKKQNRYLEAAEIARDLAIDFFDKKGRNSNTLEFLEKYLAKKSWSKNKKRIVRALYASLLETDYGADMKNVVLSDERYLTLFDCDEENDGKIVGGYEQLTAIFSKNLSIEYQTQVSAINYEDEKVVITTNKGIYTCEKVIVTVSLGVLKNEKIAFTPSLSKGKKSAIQKMGYGNLEKVVLTFEERFWEETQLIYYIEETKNGFAFPMICDFSKTSGVPALVLFYAGSFGEFLQKQSDDFIISKALDVLKNIFNKKDIQPKNHYISRWSTNDLFFGSYSYSSDDDVKKYIKSIRKPIDNKVFFGGEATSLKGQAYVHGAIFSGIREAKRLGASEDIIASFIPV